MRRRSYRLAIAAICLILVSVIGAVAANRENVVQKQSLATVTVTIQSDGAERQYVTAQGTVGATLKEAGIEVGPLVEVRPATTARTRNGMKIAVVRICEAMETEKVPIKYETVRTFTNELRPGEKRVTTPGVPGEKVVRFIVRYENGKIVKKTKLGSTVIRQPVSEVVSYGMRGHAVTRGGRVYRTTSIIQMMATAYDPSPRSNGGWGGRTASGMRAQYGVVAVDPRVIPLGTHLYVEGYGACIAGDTGGAIKGNRIDLCYNTAREANNFGRRRVKVHILK